MVFSFSCIEIEIELELLGLFEQEISRTIKKTRLIERSIKVIDREIFTSIGAIG